MWKHWRKIISYAALEKAIHHCKILHFCATVAIAIALLLSINNIHGCLYIETHAKALFLSLQYAQAKQILKSSVSVCVYLCNDDNNADVNVRYSSIYWYCYLVSHTNYPSSLLLLQLPLLLLLLIKLSSVCHWWWWWWVDEMSIFIFHSILISSLDFSICFRSLCLCRHFSKHTGTHVYSSTQW